MNFPGHSTFTNCIITENSSNYDGGGISTGYNDPIFVNCIIAENSTTHSGGGISARFSDPTLTNCVITNNSAAGSGDGIACQSSARATLTNCILWNNPEQITFEDGYAPLVSYSDVEGGWSGEGNIDADPRFVSRHGFGYLLNPTSPCIDAGDPSVEDGIYDQHPRWPDRYPNGRRADMGAFGGPCNGGWLGLECR